MSTQKGDEQMRGEGVQPRPEKRDDVAAQAQGGEADQNDRSGRSGKSDQDHQDSDAYAILADQPEKEKKTLKGKIIELENTINTKIVQLQKELNETKENRQTQDDFNFADILKEFKEEITQKINQVTQAIEKKVEEQNLKHAKLFSILVSLKNENFTISKSISLLNDKIHMIEGEIGE
ncbi:conserved Plasmodium protein, unknown function [Plasmodium vivax]|uniref:Uncharacterized protein n=4 Tax=Plasmodium vivax TaxID=5855 RepID=A0A0J9WB13_PLAVI|nr:hypothetical protein PVIIG_05177 [Plasmodium vivax India VII]KMZ84966.1 hypothetical protein PVBG_01365 [Plasmodium vivax Brazil I]KMZ97943.1 hypothetical protein PVNG_00281 [Plasmodium vivax North Korean]CAG9473468.1 unnamed protein product [Plasmodium vivax]CAI7722103.1 conserved Plasmodium protein, unknown function [Plasmodium vivax]